jgi:hypothetical protein
MDNVALAHLYFKLFSDKNIVELSKLFHDTVTLTDWEISAVGYDNVVTANKNIFDNVDTIKVDVVTIAENRNIVIAELLITVNGKDTLDVVDVLSITDNKISSIKAFKR